MFLEATFLLSFINVTAKDVLLKNKTDLFVAKEKYLLHLIK